MSAITKGMIVELISGGPKMSVMNVSDYSSSGGPKDGVECVWFDSKHSKCDQVFDAAVLKEHTPRSISSVVGRSY
jgi:uncharacterized protein YodC (DUF2158 family)